MHIAHCVHSKCYLGRGMRENNWWSLKLLTNIQWAFIIIYFRKMYITHSVNSRKKGAKYVLFVYWSANEILKLSLNENWNLFNQSQKINNEQIKLGTWQQAVLENWNFVNLICSGNLNRIMYLPTIILQPELMVPGYWFFLFIWVITITKADVVH